MSMVANLSSVPSKNPNILDMEVKFYCQKAAATANPYPTLEKRIELLKRFKPLLQDNVEAFCQALNEDFSCRSEDETKMAEILVSLEAVHYHIKKVRKWMKPSKRKVSILSVPGSAKVIYQPLGVAGIIVPWNYPINLAIGPMLAAVTAGNRVMVKMSEFTPATSKLFAKLVSKYFSEDEVAVVNGEAEVGAAFSALPFDHLLFTGSTSVGKHIMRAAAENLTPVTLELGGKSPAIISEDVPMKDAAERIAFGKAFNAGQTCVSPDYVLCPEQRIEEFIEAFSAQISKMYPSKLNNKDYTAIINERQQGRLLSYLDDAEKKGARIIEINPASEDFTNSRKIPITLVTGTSDDMLIMQDEIFGPLLCLVPYKGLDSALKFVAESPRPLALYYFDYDKRRCDYVVHNSHSGGVGLNDTLNHVGVDDIPFSGIGSSGMGHYHGYEGFLTFSKTKGIYSKGKLNSTRFIMPPYGKWVHKCLYKFVLKQNR